MDSTTEILGYRISYVIAELEPRSRYDAYAMEEASVLQGLSSFSEGLQRVLEGPGHRKSINRRSRRKVSRTGQERQYSLGNGGPFYRSIILSNTIYTLLKLGSQGKEHASKTHAHNVFTTKCVVV